MVIPPFSTAVAAFHNAVRNRNDAPAMLVQWIDEGRLLPTDLPDVVRWVWRIAEGPSRSVGVREWVSLFRAAAYPAPKVALTVYRGTTRGRRRGMAWTTDLDKARWFADRWILDGGYSETEVVTVVVPPAAVLCQIDEGREAEVVVDPSMLPAVHRIEIHPASAPSVVLPTRWGG